MERQREVARRAANRQRRSTPLLVLPMLLAGFALAGCVVPDVGNGNQSSFDGEAALEFVNQIVYEPNGSLRPLVPGHPRHQEAAEWLALQATTGAWQVRQDSFNGSQYVDLDKGAVDSYHSSSRWCGEQDRQQLADLHFTNIYSTLAGKDVGHVVLAAHWDGKEEASQDDNQSARQSPVPAANDGASGVALLLQLQRHLVQNDVQLPFDLTIAFFDGEDGFEDCHPLAGSLWAARNQSLGDIDQLILLDMVGDSDARFIRESQSVQSDPKLVEAVWALAPDFGLAENFVLKQQSISDDHVPFIEEGIQAVDIIDAGRSGTFPPYWHTTQDTPDKLSSDMLAKMGALVTEILTGSETQPLLLD